MMWLAEFYMDPAVQAVLTWLGTGLAVLAVLAWGIFKRLAWRARRGAPPPGGGASPAGGAVMSGVPPWVGLSGLFGVGLLLLRLGSGALASPPAEIAGALAGGYLTLERPRAGETLAALAPDGGLAAIPLRPQAASAAPRQGRWRVSEARELCLALPATAGGAAGPTCLRVALIGGAPRVALAGAGTASWQAPGATAGGDGSGDLGGAWTLYGYSCPGGGYPPVPATVTVTGVRVAAVTAAAAGCLPEGALIWRGTWSSDGIDVSVRRGDPAGKPAWHTGRVAVIAAGLMVLEPDDAGDRLILRRRR